MTAIPSLALSKDDMPDIAEVGRAYSILLKPAEQTEGNGFEQFISSKLSSFNFGLSHDATEKRYRVYEFCDVLGKYPAWAITYAFQKEQRHSDNVPSIKDIVEWCEIECGGHLRMQKMLREQWKVLKNA